MWISTKDKMPDLDQWAAWWDTKGDREPCIAYRSQCDIETWWEGYTHYMPIDPPKEEK